MCVYGNPPLSEKLEYLFFSLGYFLYFRAISWTLYNKYFGKLFSALCVHVFPELFRIFPNFDISWYMTKDSEVHLKNCLLIYTCSTSSILYSMVGLVVREFISGTRVLWIKSWVRPYFLYRNKTLEYSEIYREQLTSEHFLLYNYRSSTLPGISRNIGRLLGQCASVPSSCFMSTAYCDFAYAVDKVQYTNITQYSSLYCVYSAYMHITVYAVQTQKNS